PPVEYHFEPSGSLAIQFANEYRLGRRFQQIGKKAKVEHPRSVGDGLIPHVELSCLVRSHFFFRVLRKLVLDFIERRVGKAKNGGLEPVVQKRRSGEFV